MLTMRFLVAAVAAVLLLLIGTARAAEVVERSFTSTKPYADAFSEAEVDVVFTAPSGREFHVPAFWAGRQQWRVRYASAEAGTHRFRTVCSDAANASLHDVKGEVEIAPYAGTNPLYRHGPIRISANKRYFEHADGTPFFWLADTQWMGLTKRIAFPQEFERLADDRVAKGFTVVQIVAGLYPDMPAFDSRGTNEAGFPWEVDYARINPAYFDEADKRIQSLVAKGLAPCVVGAWGYHLPWLGEERMKKHWRYVIARWGAYPVFWCVAGEGAMPYYMLPAEEKPKHAELQRRGWTEIARYVRETDPFDRPITVHPTDLSRNQVTDPSVLDFEMLQTGHGDRASIGPTIALLRASRAASAKGPAMPTINSEVCYEGILGTCDAKVVRIMSWTSLLAGTAGHTYGANGIWQVNRRGQPYGKSPHGGNWGETPWDEAMKLPGSAQTGLAKKRLERFEWWRFEPREDWAAWEPSSNGDAPIAWGDWIWHAADGNAAHDAPVARRTFRTTFTPNRDMRSTVIIVSADDRFTVFVNGRPVGQSDAGGESWRRPRRFELVPYLAAGENVIEIVAENVASNVPNNPAGLIVGSDLETLRSGAGWKSRDDDGGGWERVKVLAKHGAPPWGTIATREPPLPPQAAGVGGVVRVIYLAEPTPVRVTGLERNVEWVAEHFDPAGGATTPLTMPAVDDGGACRFDPPAGADDWVLVLRRR